MEKLLFILVSFSYLVTTNVGDKSDILPKPFLRFNMTEAEKSVWKRTTNCIRKCKTTRVGVWRVKDVGGFRCIKRCVDKRCGKSDQTMIDCVSDHINALCEENMEILEEMSESQLCNDIAMALTSISSYGEVCKSSFRCGQEKTNKWNCILECIIQGIVRIDKSEKKGIPMKTTNWTTFKFYNKKTRKTNKAKNILPMILLFSIKGRLYPEFREKPISNDPSL